MKQYIRHMSTGIIFATSLEKKDNFLEVDSATKAVAGQSAYIDSQIKTLSDFRSFYISADGQKHPIQVNDDWQLLECSYNDILVKDGDVWIKRTAEYDLKEKKKRVKQKIADYAKKARLGIVDNADPVKVGQYVLQTQFASQILTGTASEAVIKAALDSKYAKDNNIKDVNQLANIWMGKALLMLGGGNTVDDMEKSAFIAVDNATGEQLDTLVTQLESNADQALPQFLGILTN